MTFAEADAQYELVKQSYRTGVLTDQQFDDRLRELMVMDELGRWWAKSRENGTWHYYDAGTNSWVPATPPGTEPPPLTSVPSAKDAASKTSTPSASKSSAQVVSKSLLHSTAKSSTQSTPKSSWTKPVDRSPASSMPAASTSSPALGANSPAGPKQGSIPKWAAVVPSTANQSPGASTRNPAQSVAPGAPGTAAVPGPAVAGGQAGATPAGTIDAAAKAAAPAVKPLKDFRPVGELSGSLKIVFYILSILVPVLGVVLYFVYHNKPAQEDRSAARLCLILGIVSLVLYGLCGAIPMLPALLRIRM